MVKNKQGASTHYCHLNFIGCPRQNHKTNVKFYLSIFIYLSIYLSDIWIDSERGLWVWLNIELMIGDVRLTHLEIVIEVTGGNVEKNKVMPKEKTLKNSYICRIYELEN